MALLGVLGGVKPFGTLRRWGVFTKLTSAYGQPDSVGASGKGLGFFLSGVCLAGGTVFTGLET